MEMPKKRVMAMIVLAAIAIAAIVSKYEIGFVIALVSAIIGLATSAAVQARKNNNAKK